MISLLESTTPGKKYPITEISVNDTLKYQVIFTQIKYFFKPSGFVFVKYDEFCQILLNNNRKYNYREEFTGKNTLNHKGKKFPIITLWRKKYSIRNESNAFK